MAIVPKPNDIAQFVFFVRGEKEMLDVDLANLYGVAVVADHVFSQSFHCACRDISGSVDSLLLTEFFPRRPGDESSQVLY